MALSRERRHAIEHSRIFVCVVSKDWLIDPYCQEAYAYARQRGMPIRVLVMPGVRLPEDAFLDVADLAIVASQGVHADTAQIRAWIAEVTPCEPA